MNLTNLIKQIVPESIIEKKDEDETTFEVAEKEFEETLIPLSKMTLENNNEISKGSEQRKLWKNVISGNQKP